MRWLHQRQTPLVGGTGGCSTSEIASATCASCAAIHDRQPFIPAMFCSQPHEQPFEQYEYRPPTARFGRRVPLAQALPLELDELALDHDALALETANR